MPTLYSSLAQSVEHMTVNHGVVGSSPTGGAKYGNAVTSVWRHYLSKLRAFSSVGQSSRLITGRSWVRVPEGPPTTMLKASRYRGIAQLVERRSPKP